MKIGLADIDTRIILVGMVWMLLETYAAYRGGWLIPNQVMERWGKPGISFSTHGGMYGDFLLPFLFAFIVARYGKTWDMEQVARMLGIGVAVTLANHLLLIFTQAVPDPLGWKGEKWSALIALHFVYMSVAIALAGLFYFSPGVSVRAAVVVSVLLGIHMAAGTHVFLGIANLWGTWVWCPDFLSSPVLPYLTAVIWVTLAWLSWIAAGWRAGIPVALIGIGLAGMAQSVIQFAPDR